MKARSEPTSKDLSQFDLRPRPVMTLRAYRVRNSGHQPCGGGIRIIRKKVAK